MKKSWINHCLLLSEQPADFYSGARKILRASQLEFDFFGPSVKLEDAGFTTNKMRMLEKNYHHVESQHTALQLWEKRLSQDKYGSVGFTTYNHFIKGDVQGHTKRGSVFGPCIQSITITYINKNSVAVDVFYRTTELFKKFPADLVLIKNLLKPFKLHHYDVRMTFHFANITLHPMYFVTIVPHLLDPIASLEFIRIKDHFFFDWIVKWSARYVCDEHHRGIAKFAQALRVQMDARARIPNVKELADYLRANHPGHKNSYKEDSDED
jgi:hypothetical protein